MSNNKNFLTYRRKGKVSRVLKIILLIIFTFALFAIITIPLMIFLTSYFFYIFIPLCVILFDIVAIVEKKVLKEPPKLISNKKLLLSWIPFFCLSLIFVVLAKLLETASSFPIEKIPPLLESLTLFSNSILLALENKRNIDQKSFRSWTIDSAVYVSLTIPFLIVAILLFFGSKGISPRIEDFSFEVALTGFLLLTLMDRRKYFLCNDNLKS